MIEFFTYLVFSLYLLLVVGGALVAVLSRSLVRALVGLIGSLFGVAGLYLMLNTPFMALMQLLIYIGAVGVLIFFAVMLTRGVDKEENDRMGKGKAAAAVLTGFLPVAGILVAYFATSWPEMRLTEDIGLAEVGRTLLGPYVLAFELISVVLFTAMAGAVLLGFKRREPR